MDGLVKQTASLPPPLPEWVERRRIDVHEYHRMAAAGLLDENDRVELIEGELVAMSPVGVGHVGCVMALTRLLTATVGNGGMVSVQNPVRLELFSEPEPDLVLLRNRADDYRTLPVAPGDVLLLIEVSDTSLRYDRELKAKLYARHGIGKYWIVDVAAKSIVTHGTPGEDGYANVSIHHPGTSLPLPGFTERQLDVSDIVG